MHPGVQNEHVTEFLVSNMAPIFDLQAGIIMEKLSANLLAIEATTCEN